MHDLDLFAVVVEHQSLNKAAQLVNLSQPALSRRIQNLEEELGVKLFERKGRRLELTRAGHLCYEYALEWRKLTAEFRQRIRSFQSDSMPGSITIGASLTTLQATLPELIRLFVAQYPDTDIKVMTGKTHEIVHLVREKEVDVGLIASRVEHPGLNCLPLFDDHLRLVLPKGHPLADKVSIRMNDLNQLPMIVFSRGTWYRVLMDELFQQYGAYPNIKMEIDSFEAILRLVSTLQTATLLPMSYLKANVERSGDFILRNIPELEQTKRTTSLLYSEEVVKSGALLHFLQQAQTLFASFRPD